jgi:glucuronokinase
VHSSVKDLWAQRDPHFLSQVQIMIRNTEEGVEHLKTRNYAGLAVCLSKNFQMRREIYGDAVVGALNVSIAEMAQSLGLAVKFTGSGGAFVCLRQSGKGWFNMEEEENLREQFVERGFAFVRISLPNEI